MTEPPQRVLHPVGTELWYYNPLRTNSYVYAYKVRVVVQNYKDRGTESIVAALEPIPRMRVGSGRRVSPGTRFAASPIFLFVKAEDIRREDWQ